VKPNTCNGSKNASKYICGQMIGTGINDWLYISLINKNIITDLFAKLSLIFRYTYKVKLNIKCVN